MKGYKQNIESLTDANPNFRSVAYTGKHLQLVVMNLPPSGEIGVEVHKDIDQFFRFEHGTGKVIIDDTEYTVADGDVVVVPAGATHNVINTSDTDHLTMYTVYAPPHHKEGIVHVTKADAEADHEEFDGVTSE